MVRVIPVESQAYGAFNNGQIVENKPIGFPQDGGFVRPYSNLFYWAYAEAKVDSTIGLHPHQGFEIMSFVLNGSVRHFDTKLNDWKPLSAGDAQIIRAGKGISHSEFLAKDASIFQIWLDPDLSKTMSKAASYDDYASNQFPITTQGAWTIKTYIGENSPFSLDTVGIGIQQIEFEASSQSLEISKDNVYSIYVLDGYVIINGESVERDGFVIVTEEERLQIESTGAGKLFLIESPEKVPYATYQELMQARMRQ